MKSNKNRSKKRCRSFFSARESFDFKIVFMICIPILVVIFCLFGWSFYQETYLSPLQKEYNYLDSHCSNSLESDPSRQTCNMRRYELKKLMIYGGAKNLARYEGEADYKTVLETEVENYLQKGYHLVGGATCYSVISPNGTSDSYQITDKIECRQAIAR